MSQNKVEFLDIEKLFYGFGLLVGFLGFISTYDPTWMFLLFFVEFVGVMNVFSKILKIKWEIE